MAQLLRAAGAEWELEIVGKLPELPPFLSSTPSTEVYVEGPLDELSVIDRATQELRPQNGRSALEPFLFEAVRYEIYFEAKDGSAQITLPGGAEFRSRRGETEHYAIDFGANVGFFEILIKAPSGVTRLKLEVFS